MRVSRSADYAQFAVQWTGQSREENLPLRDCSRGEETQRKRQAAMAEQVREKLLDGGLPFAF